jgi:hypothetical protein
MLVYQLDPIPGLLSGKVCIIFRQNTSFEFLYFGIRHRGFFRYNKCTVRFGGKPMSQDEPQVQDMTEEAQGASAPSLEVWGVLRYCLALLHSQSWQALGLVPNPATGKIEKDLAQAQVAIDAVGYLAKQLEAKLTGPELREMRNLVADLKMNFVNQQKAEGEASQPPPSE